MVVVGGRGGGGEQGIWTLNLRNTGEVVQSCRNHMTETTGQEPRADAEEGAKGAMLPP